jgi:hypothetical protein
MKEKEHKFQKEIQNLIPELASCLPFMSKLVPTVESSNRFVFMESPSRKYAVL